MKTALIFGVTGQDGAFLSKHLLNNGYKVYGTTRNAKNVANLTSLRIAEKVSLHLCDVLSSVDIKNIIDWVCPNEIYFLGGQTSVGASFAHPLNTIQTNSFTTLYILEAIRELCVNCKFYNAASSEIFGNTAPEGANEHTQYNPLSPYAVAKILSIREVELYRGSFGIFAVNGILFNHESYLRPEKFVTQKIISSAALIKLGKLKKLELGNLDVCRDWGWAPEFVTVMHSLLQQSEPEDFVIGTGSAVSLKEFVSKVFDFFDLDYQKYVFHSTEYVRSHDISFSKADPSKAASKLGWKATVTLDQSIAFMCDYKINQMSDLR